MVANRVFSMGEAKFSPAALKDTITGLVEPILVDFGWSEEKQKKCAEPELNPRPKGAKILLCYKKDVKRHPLI